jgi:L-threonylcarbamoyladenylate synthase
VKIVPFNTVAEARDAINDVRAHLERGGLIAYPTETVYGFGCLLRDDALARLAELKGRDATKPFLLLTPDPRTLDGLLWRAPAETLARAFWPGPLTIALRATADDPYPPQVVSGDATVAVRQTPLATLQILLAALNGPLTSTSANAPGEPPAMSAQAVVRVLDTLAASDIVVLDGGTIAPSAPSTVIDCGAGNARLVRAGAIAASAVRDTLAKEGFTLDV